MRTRLVAWIGVAAVIIAAAFWKLAPVSIAGQEGGSSPRTSWGEPDLQGIWTYEYDTPLQRPAQFANQEFFTAEQAAELDKRRAALLSRDQRVERGTELDVAGAYNSVYLSFKRTGRRTSLIVDPPNGRIPPLTPEAQQRAADDRAFRLALLQATQTCKNHSPACSGGKYDPRPSSRLTERPPRYNTGRMNRFDGPEDGGLADRCLADNGGALPAFGGAYGGSFRRIVQTPGGITMYYDLGQGQGFQRNIVMNGSPHLPAHIRQSHGDSRGHWEGDTLVVDATNFSPKIDYLGSRDHLHLVERWTRVDASTLRYVVTIEDATVWTRPWTATQDFTRQSDEQNRIYYEPRCHEGNIAFPTMMLNARLADKAFAEGREPHPATNDNATDFVGVEDNPLGGQ